jgi:hypothetical protein
MRVTWILRFAVAVLKYPAPDFCARWGSWTPENKRRGIHGRWIWRQDVSGFAAGR